MVSMPHRSTGATHVANLFKFRFGPKIHLIPHLASESPPTVRPQFMPINPVMWVSSLVFKARVAFNGGKVSTRDWIGRAFLGHEKWAWGSHKSKFAKPGKLIAGVEVYDDLLRRRADIKGDSSGSGEGDVDEVLMVGLIATSIRTSIGELTSFIVRFTSAQTKLIS
ncbi:hypothetical protein C1H46_012961 [Malus baccata]|uniref:Uncharacterized protein n=1 Tax=Malus baccata TaxID=106549 RepID=A0A540MSP3_MALBA|nr:hypothetical protein C1H46_012961 [Malus baccata]